MFLASALLDFSNPQQPDGPRLRHAFGAPRQTLIAHRSEDVRAVLDAVEAAARQGAWCVGYLCYEAAVAFDAALAVHPADGPLAWFAIHDHALPWPAEPVDSHGSATSPEVQWHSALPRPAFDAALHNIAKAIAEGSYYQVNYTAQMEGMLAHGTVVPTMPPPAAASGALAPQVGRTTPEMVCKQNDSARCLFAALQRAQPGGYTLFVDTGDTQVLSVSPELFFDWHMGNLLTRPMKGTAPRGATPAQDDAQATALRNSPKERAENVMVVDMLRNDLSRIAEPFSVQVPHLFQTEALPSVWQMTSDVTARSVAGCTLADVFTALFPCGSITGAPKVQAMRAIRALEPAPRGIYCGALGVVQPGGRATFNVPIRTVTLRGTVVRCGIGSGITAGSTPGGEWREWQHKQAFVQRASASFALLETLGLLDGQLRNAPAHLARMADAARHFGYPCDATRLNAALQQLAQTHPQGAWRVRLLLDGQGAVTVQAFALPPSPARVRLQLADRPLDEAHGEFVRFKTTHRPHYDAFTPTDPDVFDTLLWNAEREVTECTRGNVALLLRGQWVTPPLSCGLLAGVGRADALAQGRVQEAVVHLTDLPEVTEMAFLNSLRGWITAEISPPRSTAARVAAPQGG